MKYHFFLHYGWFLQNLGNEAVRTNMHTTVVRGWLTFGSLKYYVRTTQFPSEISWPLSIEVNNWLKFLYKTINRSGLNRWQDKHRYMFTLCNSLLTLFLCPTKGVQKYFFKYLCKYSSIWSCSSFSSVLHSLSIGEKCRPLSQFLWHSHFSL